MNPELTKSQWKRRALKAEAELRSLQSIHRYSHEYMMMDCRFAAHAKVILREIVEIIGELDNGD